MSSMATVLHSDFRLLRRRFSSSPKTTASLDSNSNSANRNSETRPTYVVLPKKKPLKWSTGTGLGEYGGPPESAEPRKYWGGEGKDPLTSKDDFIWNKDFMPRMKRLLNSNAAAAATPPTKEEPSGFLSLHRVMRLDSLELDLSKELAAPSRSGLDEKLEHASNKSSLTENPSNGSRWRSVPRVPTKREQVQWEKAGKASLGGSGAMLRNLKKEPENPEVLAAQSRELYLKLKTKLQNLTLGIGVVGVISAYISYSPEIAASFSVGFVGSLVYVRMLGNSVDSMADGAKGIIKGAIGQPRLLVPVVLVMTYNRWNGILAPDYGLMHLELIPMLVGFFTFKIATFVLVIEEALPTGWNEKTR